MNTELNFNRYDTKSYSELVNELTEIRKVLTERDSLIPIGKKGGISSEEQFSYRLENREKIQKWAKDAGIPISKKMSIDFTFIKRIELKINNTPTKEEIFQIIEKLLNIETID
jgi:hypothetical protein